MMEPRTRRAMRGVRGFFVSVGAMRTAKGEALAVTRQCIDRRGQSRRAATPESPLFSGSLQHLAMEIAQLA
jgi:hypothetical protein